MTTRIDRRHKIRTDGFYQGVSTDTLRCGGCNCEVKVERRAAHAQDCDDLQRLTKMVEAAIARKHEVAPPRARHSQRRSASMGFRFNW